MVSYHVNIIMGHATTIQFAKRKSKWQNIIGSELSSTTVWYQFEFRVPVNIMVLAHPGTQ